MLNEFLAWWLQQLLGLAEPVLTRFQGAQPDALLVIESRDGNRHLELARRRRGRTEPIGSLSATAESGDLDRLAAGHRRRPVSIVLRRPPLILAVDLPAAAAGNLEPVLQYEMDRLTPFRPEDVFFQARILSHDRARGTIRVELALVPRAWVADILSLLQAHGIAADTLEAAEPRPCRIPLDRGASTAHLRQRQAHRIMLAAIACLAAAVVILPAVRQSLALASADDRIAELRPRVDQAEAMRRRIDPRTAGSGQIAAARQQAALPLTVLADLTDILPDDTWLTGLTLRQNRLTIEGHSRSATHLIAALAAQPRLRNPAFAAPVVRSDNGEDIFTIQAEVVP